MFNFANFVRKIYRCNFCYFGVKIKYFGKNFNILLPIIANEIFFGEFQILCEGAQNVPLESKRLSSTDFVATETNYSTVLQILDVLLKSTPFESFWKVIQCSRFHWGRKKKIRESFFRVQLNAVYLLAHCYKSSFFVQKFNFTRTLLNTYIYVNKQLTNCQQPADKNVNKQLTKGKQTADEKCKQTADKNVNKQLTKM